MKMDDEQTSPIFEQPRNEECIQIKPGSRFYIRARFVLIFLTFWSCFHIFSMRVNINVALVAMVKTNGSDRHQYSYCKKWINSSSHDSAGEFEWNEDAQGQIFSAFGYGYILTLLPAGWLSGHFGGKWLLGFSVLLSAFLTLAIPFAAYQGLGFIIAIRFLLGIVQGLYFPALNSIYGAWLPPGERTILTSVSASGILLGSMTIQQVAGVLISSDFLHGWPLVFYVSGVFSLLWFPLWCCLAYSTPSSHPWISQSEKNYIMSSLEQTNQGISSTPWRKILTSKPVIAGAVAKACAEFGFSGFMTEMPIYLSRIQGFDITAVGVLVSLPYFIEFVTCMIVSIIADILISKKVFKVGIIRKTMAAIAMLGQSGLLLIGAYSGCNTVVTVTCLLLSHIFGGFSAPSIEVNVLDIGPRFAGVINSIANTCAALGSAFGPTIISAITHDQSVVEWRLVFWITSGVFWFGLVVFTLFGSGERQEWDKEVYLDSDDESQAEHQPLLS